jgi:hypothetical protein
MIVIENAKYEINSETNENSGISCTYNGVLTSVPLVVGNKHYDEIMRQVDANELTIANAD